MTLLHSVVVGLDGAEPARDALRWLSAHVDPDADIHLVHAVPPVAELAFAARQSQRQDSRHEVAEQLETVWSEPARSIGLDTETRVVDGDPAEALIVAATEVDADAIVIGPHGRGHPSKHLGSVTRKLARRSPVPLVIARLHQRTDDRPGSVLACLSYGAPADASAAWAARFAAGWGLSLDLLHVVRHRPVFPIDAPTDSLASLLGGDLSWKWARADLDAVADEARTTYPDLRVRGEIAVGGVVRNVLQRAESAEIVVLGQSHNDVVLRGLACSRTRQIVAHAPVPVALIPATATRFGAGN